MDLYIIQSKMTGDFKVGKSKNPVKRLKQLQTGSPYELKLILTLKEQGHKEKYIHKYIMTSNKRKCKGEWCDFDLLACLPDDIYEQLDLEIVNVWWNEKV